MLGYVDNLCYANHDVKGTDKFPEFVQHVYMEIKGVSVTRIPILEPKQSIKVLYNTGIMNLLEIPHFSCSLEINACVKIILSYIDGGMLWLDPPVSIYTQLIVWITGFPKAGEDLTTLFTNKAREKALSKTMKDKFNTFIGKRGMDVANISDNVA